MVYIYLIDTVCLSGLDGKTIYFLNLNEMDGKAHIYNWDVHDCIRKHIHVTLQAYTVQ